MKKLVVLVLVLVAGLAYAADMEFYGDAKTHETIGGDNSTAKGMSANTYGSGGFEAKACMITAKSNTAHFTVDSATSPTAAAGTNVGHPITSNGSYLIRGINNIKNFKFINAVSGSTATLNVTCFF